MVRKAVLILTVLCLVVVMTGFAQANDKEYTTLSFREGDFIHSIGLFRTGLAYSYLEEEGRSVNMIEGSIGVTKNLFVYGGVTTNQLEIVGVDYKFNLFDKDKLKLRPGIGLLSTRVKTSPVASVSFKVGSLFGIARVGDNVKSASLGLRMAF